MKDFLEKARQDYALHLFETYKEKNPEVITVIRSHVHLGETPNEIEARYPSLPHTAYFIALYILETEQSDPKNN